MCFSKCFENVFLKTVTAWFKIKPKVKSRGQWKTQHSKLIGEEIKDLDFHGNQGRRKVLQPLEANWLTARIVKKGGVREGRKWMMGYVREEEIQFCSGIRFHNDGRERNLIERGCK